MIVSDIRRVAGAALSRLRAVVVFQEIIDREALEAADRERRQRPGSTVRTVSADCILLVIPGARSGSGAAWGAALPPPPPPRFVTIPRLRMEVVLAMLQRDRMNAVWRPVPQGVVNKPQARAHVTTDLDLPLLCRKAGETGLCGSPAYAWLFLAPADCFLPLVLRFRAASQIVQHVQQKTKAPIESLAAAPGAPAGQAAPISIVGAKKANKADYY